MFRLPPWDGGYKSFIIAFKSLLWVVCRLSNFDAPEGLTFLHFVDDGYGVNVNGNQTGSDEMLDCHWLPGGEVPTIKCIVRFLCIA
jgi:hypothetical protein